MGTEDNEVEAVEEAAAPPAAVAGKREYPKIGFVLSLIAGILIVIAGIMIMIGGTMFGSMPGVETWCPTCNVSPQEQAEIAAVGSTVMIAMGAIGLVLGIIILLLDFLLVMKNKTVAGGVGILILSIISIAGGGGFFLGLILGFVGGILVLVKK